MLHGASLTEPTVAAYPSFGPYSLSNLSTSVSLAESSVLNGHHNSANGYSPATSAAVAALTAAAAAPNIKDSRWLTLEVCRRYQRNQCLRDENECKFAHPPTHVDVQDGRVVCCYDSIKGKCQRRDPPCKYLHPPQHLREQLMRNGRNNMIIRNMQLQLFQQQLLAQSGGMLPFNAAAAAAVAAAAICTSPGTNSSPITGTNTPNSLLYPTPGPITLGNSSVSTAYPFLNLGFPPYLNALTTSSLNGHTHTQLSGTGSDPESSATPPKRTSITDIKNGLPLYMSRQNGTQSNGTGKMDKHETSTNCVMVVNGGTIDSIHDTTSNGSPTVTLRTTTGNPLINATAATIYALQHPQNMMNVPPHAHQQHPMAGPLTAVSLAAVVNGTMAGNSVTPAHFSTVHDHAGYFQPAYHIEIPPYPYH